MKQAVFALFVAGALVSLAEDPAWPENFWEQVAAGRAAAAEKGRTVKASDDDLSPFDSYAKVWACSDGIDFRSDKSGMVIILR